MPARKYTDAERKAAKERRRIKSREWRIKNAARIAVVAKAWAANNQDKLLARTARWRVAHPERVKEVWRRHERNNKDRRRMLRKKWKEENADSYRKQQAEYRRANRSWLRLEIKKWLKLNPDRRRAAWQRRYARIKGQLHNGNDKSKEMIIYRSAIVITKTTGTPHEVDHIIPLNSGGWHHHKNLQVIPSALNSSKSHNHFWEMSGYLSWRDVPRFLWPEQLVPEYDERMRATPLATAS